MWYLELLCLSCQADGIHHGDKDGDITQGAAHAPRYADTQRIAGTFNELNRPGVLMIGSCERSKQATCGDASSTTCILPMAASNE